MAKLDYPVGINFPQTTLRMMEFHSCSRKLECHEHITIILLFKIDVVPKLWFGILKTVSTPLGHCCPDV